MSKQTVNLSLIEMYAIKHALQKQVNEKSKRLEEIYTKDVNDWDDDIEREGYELNSDITHEEALILRFETLIREFKVKYQIGRIKND